MTSVVVKRRKATVVLPQSRTKIKQRINELSMARFNDDEPSSAVKGFIVDAERMLAEGKLDLAEICVQEAENEIVKSRWAP
jgi:hypothetical protein